MDHEKINLVLLKKISISIFISLILCGISKSAMYKINDVIGWIYVDYVNDKFWLSDRMFGNDGSTLIIFSIIIVFAKLLNLWNYAGKVSNSIIISTLFDVKKYGYKFKIFYKIFTKKSWKN